MFLFPHSSQKNSGVLSELCDRVILVCGGSRVDHCIHHKSFPQILPHSLGCIRPIHYRNNNRMVIYTRSQCLAHVLQGISLNTKKNQVLNLLHFPRTLPYHTIFYDFLSMKITVQHYTMLTQRLTSFSPRYQCQILIFLSDHPCDVSSNAPDTDNHYLHFFSHFWSPLV